MAPFLAIGGFIVAGYFGPNDTPPMRVLIAEDTCHLTEANCILKSAGIELELDSDQKPEAGKSITIVLKTKATLDDALISLAEKKQKSRPQRMKKKEDGSWQAQVIVDKNINIKKLMLRLVVGWNGNIYFADEKIKQ